jgi:hypothetical protein
MAADIITGLGIFKSIYDSAKALKDINDGTVRNAAVIELQEKILTAQEAQSALIDRIRQLEEKMRSIETWETEKQRYELKDLGWGCFAYMLKPPMRGAQPPHWICTNCYSRGHTSIIQHSNVSGVGQRYLCPMCKTQINPSPAAIERGVVKWLDCLPGEPNAET